MALVKFSSAILLVLCVSSIFSAQIDSDVYVRVRDSDYALMFSEPAGESSFEHVQSIQLSSSLSERGVKCPRVKDGAYKPDGISSCLIAKQTAVAQKRGEGFQGTCLDFNTLFTGASSIDTVSIKARECSGVDRFHCKEITLKNNKDFYIDGQNGICINDQADQVCQDSDLPKCIRYYRLVVSNEQSKTDLTKAEGQCASASTFLVVASNKAALKGLDGYCISSYQCDFEPLEFKCTYARCTFNHQPFPMYLHASNVQPEQTRGGIDIEQLVEDECYKIRVPSNQGSAALDINNPTSCGVHDSEKYGVFMTATICGQQKFYGQLVHPEPAEEGEFCASDSHCAAGTHCDDSVDYTKPTIGPFVCKTN